jgi:putative ABC transport system ATP-binding protein
MTDARPPCIAIEDLTFRYPEGHFCLHVPRLEIDTGAKAAVIGPSGSGKTTLINLLAGIVPAVGGRVTVHGSSLDKLGDAERRRFRIANIGFVFQDFALLDYLTILDNILHPYRINRALALTTQVREHAAHLAATMGIADKLNRHVHHLSQGEKQRAAICRALVTRPPLLLADEPTGNLDPANKAHILQHLFQYVAETGATLVAVTHDHGLLGEFDRVVDFQAFDRA